MSHKVAFTSSIFGGVLLATLSASAPALAEEIRWGTSRVGSSGHRAVIALSQVLKTKMPELRITVQPTPGAILTVKGHATGQFEGFYGSDVAFYELANNIRRFKGFKDKVKRAPVQSFWAFTIEMGVAIHVRDRGKIKKWGDLNGVRVFTGPRPWDTRAQLERAFRTLGIKHKYLEVSIKTAGSLLESNRFAAFGVYTNAEVTTAPWITEASLQTDWAPLDPSAGEIKALEKAGFKVVKIATSAFGKKKTNAKTITMLPFHYGLHLGSQISEGTVYKMLKVIDANAAELAQADKAFKQVAKNMASMQQRGVRSSAKFVPIHPGLAKYMREKGVWEKAWDSRVSKAK